MPAVLAAHPALVFVYLGGGAARDELRPWERIAVGYGLRLGEAVATFDEDALFADLAARFDTNDIDLFALESLSKESRERFLADAVLLVGADDPAHRRFLASRGGTDPGDRPVDPSSRGRAG